MLQPVTFTFGLSPHAWIGAGLYRENIPIHDFHNERIWSLADLQPDYQTGLGLTGGIGLQQQIFNRLSIVTEGSLVMGINRDIIGSRGGNGDIHYIRETRVRQLLSFSIGAQYTL